MRSASPQVGYQPALARTVRLRVALVLLFASLDWVGWATGVQGLTRVLPAWPQMTPWTALWLAALGLAILLQSGSPSASRVWFGRGAAALVGFFALVVLAEYATARSFGLDQVWFREAVRTMQSMWPGRPSPQTAVSALFSSVAVGLIRVNRPWAGILRAVSLVVGLAAPGMTALAYLFDAVALVRVSQSTGMSILEVLGLLLLGVATVLVRPGRNRVAWWLSRTNRWSILRMALVVAGFPLLLGAAWRVSSAVGFGVDARIALSAALGTTAIGVSIFYLSYREQQLRDTQDSDRALLQASSDAMLDPQVLLEAARDSSGRIVDFLYAEVNQAACDYLGLFREALLGRGVGETMPGIKDTLLPGCVRCLETGEPLILDDFAYDNEVLGSTLRYDLRASRAAATAIVVTWRDVTQRFENTQRIEASERQYRILAENAADVVCHIRDEKLVWVSPSVEDALGAPPEYWLGRGVLDLLPLDDASFHVEEWAKLSGGAVIKRRMRLIGVDGIEHWFELHAKPFRDVEGRPDGVTAALRLIDKKVAAEQEAEEARRQQAEANDLMRRELESAATYMSSIMPTGLTGRVAAASRYLPSRELGGDCFDYTWIDDDHLLIYLIDVSGHGIEPALLSVSVHNMIRSGSLANETMRAPGKVLTELNGRFQMDQHSGHYFTMWCGVYEASTRKLRYACAGAPPALAFNFLTGEAPAMTELSTDSMPVGMFEDTVYASATYSVPPGCRFLLYSDGAFELEPADGPSFALGDFKNLATRLASSPDGSIDELIAELRALSPTGGFPDDCSLIGLRFD